MSACGPVRHLPPDDDPRATNDKTCTEARLLSWWGMLYMIAPAGPLGFQVSAKGPDHQMRRIGDFSTEADAFTDSLRQIDASRSAGGGGQSEPP
jgi:hypothetical protein